MNTLDTISGIKEIRLESYPITNASKRCMICDAPAILFIWPEIYVCRNMSEKKREIVLEYIKSKSGLVCEQHKSEFGYA